MSTKWLREAESEIVDRIMWGENFHGVDITKVMDGEPLDELLLLVVQRKDHEAREWLKPFVIRYVQRNERLIDLYRWDENERMRDNAIDAEIERRYLIAEAV